MHHDSGSSSTRVPARSTEHGLDLRTELRFGDADAELERELSVDPNSMLVIGLDALDGEEAARVKSLLEGPQAAARAAGPYRGTG